MRVLVVTKDFPAPGLPEDGIVTLRQARSMAELGHDILVARIVPQAPPITRKWRGYRSIPASYAVEGVGVRTFRAVFPPRMLGMEYLPLQVGNSLRRLVSEFRADLVHAQCVIPSGQLAADLGVPSIVTAHGSDAYDWAWRRPGLTRAARYGLERAAAVVAVSAFIADRVRALIDRKIDVIYNGADETVFFPDDRARARRELEVDAKRFVIAFAGGPPKIKGVFDLIAAAAQLRDLRPLLLLAGPEEHRAAVLGEASAASVDAQYCGMLEHPQLAQVLAAADVFCLPSYREGLPLVVCEAMLSGRPIVATPVGGIPEILTDGKHGYLVEAGNPQALSQRLRAIAGDPGRSNQMGLAAREFALHHLTWRANAQRYNDVYHRVANLSRLERANRTA